MSCWPRIRRKNMKGSPDALQDEPQGGGPDGRPSTTWDPLVSHGGADSVVSISSTQAAPPPPPETGAPPPPPETGAPPPPPETGAPPRRRRTCWGWLRRLCCPPRVVVDPGCRPSTTWDPLVSHGGADAVVSISSTQAAPPPPPETGAPPPPPETGAQPRRWRTCWGLKWRLRTLPRREQELKPLGGRRRAGGQQPGRDSSPNTSALPAAMGPICPEWNRIGPATAGICPVAGSGFGPAYPSVRGRYQGPSTTWDPLVSHGGADAVVSISSTQAAPPPPPETGAPPKRRRTCVGCTLCTLPRGPGPIGPETDGLYPGQYWIFPGGICPESALPGAVFEWDSGAPGGVTQGDVAQAGPSAERTLVSQCRPVSVPYGVLPRPPAPAPTRQTEKQQLCVLGLPNLDQSCHLNATLQSLFTLDVFCREMERTEWAWGLLPSATVLSAFDAISRSRRSDDTGQKRAALQRFRRSVAQLAPEFRGTEQQDAHELLNGILGQVSALSPLLSSAAQHSGRTYTCPVRAHLHFNMLSTRTCRGCEGQSSSIEDFTSLSLSLSLEPGGSVSQALDTYLTESPLEYNCQCGAKTAGMQTRFLTLPNVLVLHLKRFRVSPTSTLKDMVHLSRELALSVGTGAVASSASSSKEEGKEDSNNKEKYTLVSVLSNIGADINSGHYVSEGVNLHEASHLQDQWLCYKDQMVIRTTGAAVCRRRPRAAYVLFYQRQEGEFVQGGQEELAGVHAAAEEIAR